MLLDSAFLLPFLSFYFELFFLLLWWTNANSGWLCIYDDGKECETWSRLSEEEMSSPRGAIFWCSYVENSIVISEQNRGILGVWEGY